MTTRTPQVTAMIAELSSPQKEICEQLRTLITTQFPDLEEKWGWSRPLYATKQGTICYFVANKNDVNFGFERGAHFDDPKGLLRGTGANMRHVKIRTEEEMDLGYDETLLAQAFQIAAAQQEQS
ncbi:MAG: DUF1801 domain-containing protein [Caldilineaceae bacterium]